MVALLTPAPGTSVEDNPEWDLENLINQQEAACIALPQSPGPGHRSEEDLRMGRLEIEDFSHVCTPKSHGFYSNNIERLCSNCRRERDEAEELAEWQLEAAKRRASQFDTEPEREYGTDVESMLSASEAETASVISMRSAESVTQQSQTSSGFMNFFKRS